MKKIIREKIKSAIRNREREIEDNEFAKENEKRMTLHEYIRESDPEAFRDLRRKRGREYSHLRRKYHEYKQTYNLQAELEVLRSLPYGATFTKQESNQLELEFESNTPTDEIKLDSDGLFHDTDGQVYEITKDSKLKLVKPESKKISNVPTFKFLGLTFNATELPAESEEPFHFANPKPKLTKKEMLALIRERLGKKQ